MKDKIDISLEENAIYGEVTDDEPTPTQRAQLDALGWVKGEADPITDNGVEVYGRLATEDEVKQAIEQLKADRKKVPEYSYFGDPNWQMIDAQIEILQWVLEK